MTALFTITVANFYIQKNPSKMVARWLLYIPHPASPAAAVTVCDFKGDASPPMGTVMDISLYGPSSTELSHCWDFVWNLFEVNDLVMLKDD